ncbi:MAG: hypothetical protein H0W68_05050 [Gemmatimonadaceae bacterium]|nr:hypothetical protein [Gemmatimonadaceae bacterium]
MSAVRWAAALALVPQLLEAQGSPQWRSVDISRQLRDSVPQRVKVRYTAGRVDVRGTSDPVLYAMHLRYDEGHATPLHAYDADQRSVRLGLEPLADGARVRRSGEDGELRLALPRAVPLDLDLQFGGAGARLDLGGLALRSLRLDCGATEAVLAFATPNIERMRELEVNVGAADFTAQRLANANADLLLIRAGAGAVDLDFSGRWSRDLAANVRVAVGKLVVRIPPDVGVRVELHRFAVGFEHEGLVKRDDAWYSEGYDAAQYKLRLHAESVFGGIQIRRSVR